MANRKNPSVKANAPKTSAPKPAKVAQTIVLQYGAKNIDIEAVVAKINASTTPATSLSVYFKPEDDKAYYVADGIEGSVEL